MISGFFRCLRLSCALALLAGMAGTALAGDDEVKVQAQLVWGTDLKESSSKEHKPIDDKTAADLKKAFKWKNYFIIKSETVALTPGKGKKLAMSDKCMIEIKYSGDDKFEVLLTGKGEKVAKGTQKMPSGEKVFLMGLAEDENSWLVILRRKTD